MQRFFDVQFSLIAIIILSPIIFLTSIILKFTGEGEIFYLQNRIGKNQKPFKLIKFATMVKNSEKIGAGTITVRNDPRVLPFGKILRITKINELPQLFNIFNGDMSVIGPRPLLKKQFSMYSEDDKKIISSVRPGLSGVGSIVFRDEEELLSKESDPIKFYQKTISPHKAYLEKWYVANNSISLYFKLIILTIYVVMIDTKNIEKYISSNLKSFKN